MLSCSAFVASFETLAGDKPAASPKKLLPSRFLVGIFMGDGDVEDGIRSSCLSVSSAANVGFRLRPALLLLLLSADVDADVDLLERGGGVAVDKRRRFGGGPPASDPFGLPNIMFLPSSSSGDAGRIVSVRSKLAVPITLGVVG
jgi:hypothetical protein